MNDNYYCPACDYIITELEIWWADEQDPHCPYCNQPVDHMGDSGPYDTIEEKAL